MNKLVWVSVHDYNSARICAAAGVDALLVGDSLGMSVYGFESTHSVTMRMMLDHAAAVQRGRGDITPEIIVDLPIDSYADVATALQSAAAFREIGIDHLKLEGGVSILPQIEALLSDGFHITGHLGMLPQSVKAFSIAARSAAEQEQLLTEAQALENAGVSNLVLECIPAEFAARVAHHLTIPVIGIGAGSATAGQVLVYSDLVGRTDPAFAPRFLRRFGDVFSTEKAAVASYCQAVRSGDFPLDHEQY